MIRRVLNEVEFCLRECYGVENREMCHLSVVENMCRSALWFADRVEEAKLKEGGVDCSVTHDDYKRIRVVRDRSCL